MATQNEESTRIGLTRSGFGVGPSERVHYLEIIDGANVGQRFTIGPQGLTIGRVPPADIVLPDSEVSRSHCKVAMLGEELIVTDLKSTNGTFLDGTLLSAPRFAPVGSVIRIGRQTLKHESRDARELALTEELDRDLEKASAYVQALLPPPIHQGPVVCDWVYQPSTKLGGDAFGYSQLREDVFIGYLIDVSGHGAGAAMHAVSILNVLSRRALNVADMADPVQVLSALNAMFSMDSSAGMYFTLWYGAYHVRERRLCYAAAGHHPAYLVAASGREYQPLGTRNPVIGAIDEARFTAGEAHIPAGSSLYIFSDGVFEITTSAGTQWAIEDFLPLLLRPPVAGATESERLLQAVRSAAAPAGFDDDFSMVVLKFQ